MSDTEYKSVLRVNTDVRADDKNSLRKVMEYFCGEPDEDYGDDDFYYDHSKRVGHFCPQVITYKSKEGKRYYGLNFDYVIAAGKFTDGDLISRINMSTLDKLIKGIIDKFGDNPINVRVIDFEILTYTWYNGVEEPFTYVSEGE